MLEYIYLAARAELPTLRIPREGKDFTRYEVPLGQRINRCTMTSYHLKVQTFTFLPNALKIKKIIHENSILVKIYFN